ncbi:MAG: 4Fe-4S dicluster domain-containing protein [Desulfobacteraceae bacterium]|nr:4Fe-4S dicluster domain-containing protein [Desulfobacteraceae bacterium]
MKTLTIKKGYAFNIAGPPAADVVERPSPPRIAVIPHHLRFAKPRLKVAVGDPVNCGSVLFEDKRNPEVKFLSPGGGDIIEINHGPRRTVTEIVIRLDEDEASETFESLSEADLERIHRDHLIQMIIRGGLWWLIRQLPFRDYAKPSSRPAFTLVTLGGKEPFRPLPEIYLNGKTDLFAFGLKLLEKLTGKAPLVCAPGDGDAIVRTLPEHITHVVNGKYPAHDPGTILYTLKTDPSHANAWYIDGQDLLLLAELVRTGKFPTRRIIAVGGNSTPLPGHYLSRLGVPFSYLVDPGKVSANTRYVSGGILTGYTGSPGGYMGLFETSLVLIPEGNTTEFLALFNPGLKKPTYSRSYLSRINPKPLIFDCNRHGGDRACIACMHCADVCPVNILPEFAYKAVLAGEVEEYLAHGLLDCVECGLCSYVCPSKIELTHTFMRAKADYVKAQDK